MVKKIVFFLTLSLIVLASWQCSKSDNSACTAASASSEEPAILSYIAAQSITATKDPSGMYYQIIEPGSGGSPTINSKVAVKYAGYLLNGNKFDEMTTPEPDPNKWWSLGGLIEGWKIGIPMIKKGGKIKMIIPSSLAYGCSAIGSIPANSILIFDVELVDFN
ncbi:FKBP-type peptidyl-prolyl cis-trans isomerase [Flavihumibacter fluvii]|uniref:FKBP-type peptidyl-prolyl cis-trans isomerase n=1 Tax=Flavihumibacter fluvii TaxID=2838157 RepID=UPI001BDDDF48|nr:FKBP-type peptidyl-prolyl cis-trans isomerase [Flavihumibacter fluvii]ULQ54425.1 FKBP-type peptidyl-prolyl cis-trans isomerase [Flavihumibacter fluvii]